MDDPQAVTGPERADGPETLTEWMTVTLEERERALTRSLDRIAALDPTLQAWAQVSPQRPTGDGALRGIPFGAKDIIETRGLQTEYGSPVYRGRTGSDDAAIVAELRGRGAVLLGKTHTAAFAYITPAPTRNPRHLDHTPGGSSSGSAAAVAAGMVPLALGTQTKGSILRPASYCGVTGFKPTFGLFSMEGILPVASSLDTLGFFTHTPADMRALWAALGYANRDAGECAVGVPASLPAIEPTMATAFARAVTLMQSAGVITRRIDLADLLARLGVAANTVMFYEGARVHRERYQEHGDRLGDLAALVRAGLEIPDAQYQESLDVITRGRRRLAELYAETPIIAVPAATGPAPKGLSSTGDPAMNAPWTALGTPAIAIPMSVGGGLPLGLQLTAALGEDAFLLGMAERLADLLAGPAVVE